MRWSKSGRGRDRAVRHRCAVGQPQDEAKWETERRGGRGAGSVGAPGRTGGAFYVAAVRPSNQGVWYDVWGRPNTRRYLEIQAPGAPLSSGIDRACPVPVSPTTIGQDP